LLQEVQNFGAQKSRSLVIASGIFSSLGIRSGTHDAPFVAESTESRSLVILGVRKCRSLVMSHPRICA
jgi:hypothetical protein